MFDSANSSFSLYTLGDAVASLALAGVVVQLATPRFRFQLALHPRMRLISFILYIAGGLFMPLVAGVLPYIPGKAIPGLGYPAFWEILGYILVLIATFIIYRLLHSKIIFSHKNHHVFVEKCLSGIAKGSNDMLSVVTEVLRDSTSSLIKYAAKYDPNAARQAKIQGLDYKPDEATLSADALLRFISDEKLCKYIVVSDPGVAISIVKELIKYKDSLKYLPAERFITQIVRQALLHSDSILSREKNYEGLGHINIFLTTVFSDPWIISHYRPLQAIHFYERNQITLVSIKNYCKGITAAFEVLVTQDPCRGMSAWGEGMEQLSSALYYILIKVKDENWLHNTEANECAIEIERALNKILDFFFENAEKFMEVAESEIVLDSREKYDKYRNTTILDLIATSAYEPLEKLSRFVENESYIRNMAIHIWMKIDVFETPNKVIIAVQERFFMMLEERMRENIKLYYPMMIRLVMIIIGYSIFDESMKQSKFRLKLLKFIANHLGDAFRKDPDKAKECLPEKFTFDLASNSLSTEGETISLDRFK